MVASVQDLNLYLSGGATNTDPNASIGGIISSEKLSLQDFTAPVNVTGVTIDSGDGNSVGATGGLAFRIAAAAVAKQFDVEVRAGDYGDTGVWDKGGISQTVTGKIYVLINGVIVETHTETAGYNSNRNITVVASNLATTITNDSSYVSATANGDIITITRDSAGVDDLEIIASVVHNEDDDSSSEGLLVSLKTESEAAIAANSLKWKSGDTDYGDYVDVSAGGTFELQTGITTAIKPIKRITVRGHSGNSLAFIQNNVTLTITINGVNYSYTTANNERLHYTIAQLLEVLKNTADPPCIWRWHLDPLNPLTRAYIDIEPFETSDNFTVSVSISGAGYTDEQFDLSTLQAAGTAVSSAGKINVTVSAGSLPVANQDDVITVSITNHSLYDKITTLMNAGGGDDYRCIYIKNDGVENITNPINVWVSEQVGGAVVITLGADPNGVGDGSTTGVAVLAADEETAPVGVTFSSYTNEVGGLVLASGLDVGECVALHFKRTVTANQDPSVSQQYFQFSLSSV